MTQIRPTVDAKRDAGTRNISEPRAPVQARSRERVDLILDVAADLMKSHAVNDITMALISQRSGISRPSIYQFFPTVFAIYNKLGLTLLNALLEKMSAHEPARNAPTWREANSHMIDCAVEFYNDNPVARTLLLGGGSAQELRIIDKHYDRRFAAGVRRIFADKWSFGPQPQGDPMQIAVVISTSILSLGVFEDGLISDFYREQAKRASTGYLESVTISSIP